MKQLAPIALACVLLSTACKKVNEPILTPEQPELVGKQNIDASIRSSLESQRRFEWSMTTPQVVWSALQQEDQLLSVGYKPVGTGNIDNNIHTIDIHSNTWKAAKEKLIQQILSAEQQLDRTLTREQVVIIEDETLPFINVSVKNFETVKMLRANSSVRYAEPMAYEPKPAISTDSDSGCGSNVAEGGLVAGVDY
ncbi:MAG: serine protease, partial [Chitinophagaceae bacterium]